MPIMWSYNIWKYVLPLDSDRIELKMPENANILSVQAQHDKICMWAMVNPEAPARTRAFRVVGTGHQLNHDEVDNFRVFLGTVQLHRGALVFHVFETNP